MEGQLSNRRGHAEIILIGPFDQRLFKGPLVVHEVRRRRRSTEMIGEAVWRSELILQQPAVVSCGLRIDSQGWHVTSPR